MSVETYKVEVETPPPAVLPSATTGEAATNESRERIHQAEDIIRRNTYWALGAGAIVVPVVDAIATTAVQLKMLKNLSDLYGVKFSEGLALKLLSTVLLGRLGALWAVSFSTIAKLIPGVGTALGTVVYPLTAAATTHALGRVFLLHFESGGTLLDFEPGRVREHFKHEYEKSMNVVERMQSSKSESK